MARQCKEGWITAFCRYAQNQESPEVFLTWAGISAIASVLRRRVWMDRGYYITIPNLYMVLVSPSGVGRKSTAIELAMDLIDKAKLDLMILRGKITPTRMIAKLEAATSTNPDKYAELLIYSREFKVFTKGVMSDSSLIEDLTDLYDGKIFDYETQHSIQHRVTKPCVNIMAASTPEWLTSPTGGDILQAGFGARLTPVAIRESSKKRAWPEKTKVETALEEGLIMDLQTISKLEGVFYVTKEAKALFEEWYEIKERNEKVDDRFKGYYSKKHELVLRLAMILSASQSDEKVVTDSHIEKALLLTKQIEKNMDFAYSGAGFGSDQAKWTDRVLQKIKTVGQIDHTRLLQGFHYGMTGKQLRDVIYSLRDEKLIDFEYVRTKTKTLTIYKYIGEDETTSNIEEEDIPKKDD